MGNEKYLKDLSGEEQEYAIFELIRRAPNTELMDQLRRLHELQEAIDDNVYKPKRKQHGLGLVVDRKVSLLYRRQPKP